MVPPEFEFKGAAFLLDDLKVRRLGFNDDQGPLIIF
jgi:hypothetical protein